MENMELEELQDQLSELLVQLKFEQLQEVCLQAKISTESYTRKHTLNRMKNEEEEVTHEFLLRLIAHAEEVKKRDEIQVVEDSASKDAAALANLQEQYAALQLSGLY